MKRKKIHLNNFIIVLSVVVFMASSFVSQAVSLEDIERQQEETKQQISSTEAQRQEAQNVVDQLQDEADSLGATYKSYASRLSSINAEISQAKTAMENTTSQIQSLAEELEQAKQDEAEQKEAMKLHIQYMYENRSSQSILLYLFDSESMATFVKKVEYTHAIVQNDQEMIEAYAALQETIASKSDALVAKKEEMAGYQETLSAKQGELGALTAEAQQEYANKNGEVSAAQMSVEEFDAKIAQFKQQEASLEQQYAAAQIEIAKQLAEQAKREEEETGSETIEDTSGALGYTAEELNLMAAIIQAEADGEPYAGKLAVGTVIMNRVMSSKFPNSLSGVVYQPMQFQPARNGHLDLILERGPNDTCIQAAKEVLGGYRSGDWLFFMTQYWADYYGITGYTMIGHHAFFYRWGAN